MVARTSVNQKSWLIWSAPSEAGANGQGWAAAGGGLAERCESQRRGGEQQSAN